MSENKTPMPLVIVIMVFGLLMAMSAIVMFYLVVEAKEAGRPPLTPDCFFPRLECYDCKGSWCPCPPPIIRKTGKERRDCVSVYPSPMPKEKQWWERQELAWIAILMRYGGNLEQLHAFLGKQIPYVRFCTDGSNKCAGRWVKMVRDVDAFLKKMVKDHGGPLIDRNWYKVCQEE